MYCAVCDRWEYDQIAVEDCICLRCYGPLVDPDEDFDSADAMIAARTSTRKDERA